MKICQWSALTASLLSLALGAAEIPAPATEVMIFRNNNALIRYQADPKGANSFTVQGNFSPLEGTLWYSANVKEIRKTLTEVKRKEAVPFSDITATYKNQRVTLRVNNGNGTYEKISGTVLDLSKKEQSDWRGVVTIKCADGRILALQRNLIAGVESAALQVAERTVKDTKQAWEFTMNPKASGKVTFDIISKTLGWTPALKMTLLPEKKFTISRAATVVNNGDDLKNVKCILWAGTPNIENENRISPMAIVKYLPNRPEPRMYDSALQKKSFRRNAPMDMAMAMAPAESAVEDSAPGLTGNMAPFDLGALTLKKGESLVRTLGSGSGSYENLVRWQIPARQGDDGIRVWKNHGNYTDSLMECLRFVNPLKSPLFDAPVEICDGSKVLAQIKGTWVNPGESATWEITSCRDVKVTFTEQEAPSSIKNRGADIFQRIDRTSFSPPRARMSSAAPQDSKSAIKGGFYNGNWYRVTDIKGRTELKNFRKAPVKVVIEMAYFGEFVSASGNPEKKAVNHFGSLNPKNQLVWTLVLKPGETRKIDFRYNIIINR